MIILVFFFNQALQSTNFTDKLLKILAYVYKILILIYLDPRFQTLAVFILECFFNISQIDFRTTDHYTNQRLVLGTHTMH